MSKNKRGLSGKRLVGPGATTDVVKDYLSGKRELPSLECIKDEHINQLLSGLLHLEHERRWTAETAHTHLACRMGDTPDVFGLATTCSVVDKIVDSAAKYNVSFLRDSVLLLRKSPCR